tara:strand:- start:190 stop:459 length:270 start_codon:yes stop_codon:yes gene_type:complete
MEDFLDQPNENPKDSHLWSMELSMGISEARMLYNCVSNYKKLLEASNGEKEEVEYISNLKIKLFAVIMEYDINEQFPDLKDFEENLDNK